LRIKGLKDWRTGGLEDLRIKGLKGLNTWNTASTSSALHALSRQMGSRVSRLEMGVMGRTWQWLCGGSHSRAEITALNLLVDIHYGIEFGMLGFADWPWNGMGRVWGLVGTYDTTVPVPNTLTMRPWFSSPKGGVLGIEGSMHLPKPTSTVTL